MTLDDTLSEIEERWKPLEKKEAQPASDTKRPMEVVEISWRSVQGGHYNPSWSGYDAAPVWTGFPERGWCLYSRGQGGCWNQRTLGILPPEPNARPERREGKWWWTVGAPSVSMAPESSNAPSVSSPNSSLSPEMVTSS